MMMSGETRRVRRCRIFAESQAGVAAHPHYGIVNRHTADGI
jgi:hypothetical protein